MTTPIIDECGECQFCNGFKNTLLEHCGKNVYGTEYKCTRPKEHEGFCIACYVGSKELCDHDITDVLHSIKICKICGKSFLSETRGPNAKTCSKECYKHNVRRINRKSSKKSRQNHPRLYKQRCKMYRILNRQAINEKAKKRLATLRQKAAMFDRLVKNNQLLAEVPNVS